MDMFSFSLIGAATMSWRSSKQMCITRSMMESEFNASDKATEVVEWLFPFSQEYSMLIRTCASNFVYFATTNQVLVGHR